MAREKFKLGDRVRDKVTGFTGIATAKHEFLAGCIQFSVAPPVKPDGTSTEAMSYDWERLERVDHGINEPDKEVKATPTGGPAGNEKVPHTPNF